MFHISGGFCDPPLFLQGTLTMRAHSFVQGWEWERETNEAGQEVKDRSGPYTRCPLRRGVSLAHFL